MGWTSVKLALGSWLLNDRRVSLCFFLFGMNLGGICLMCCVGGGSSGLRLITFLLAFILVRACKRFINESKCLRWTRQILSCYLQVQIEPEAPGPPYHLTSRDHHSCGGVT